MCSVLNVSMSFFQSLLSMVDATLQLIDSLLFQREMSSSLKHNVEMFKASISLILFASYQLSNACTDSYEHLKVREDKIGEALSRVQEMLWSWITDPKVIGGSIFGGNVKSWKAEEELEVNLIL